METVVLSVENMSCGGCIRRVSEALRKTAGVTIRSVGLGVAEVLLEEGKSSPAAVIRSMRRDIRLR